MVLLRWVWLTAVLILPGGALCESEWDAPGIIAGGWIGKGWHSVCGCFIGQTDGQRDRHSVHGRYPYRCCWYWSTETWIDSGTIVVSCWETWTFTCTHLSLLLTHSGLIHTAGFILDYSNLRWFLCAHHYTVLWELFWNLDFHITYLFVIVRKVGLTHEKVSVSCDI